MIGERLGRWVVYKELGSGGMGHVYLAQEEGTDRRAAVKVLSEALAREPGFRQRFQREIEAVSKLNHPHVVQFYEAGEDRGRHFYAMEYVEGQSLDKVLAERGRLPWQEVLYVAWQMCRALKHAHDHGVIHRDIKPSNLLRTLDGTLKLSDFGIAKVFAGGQLTATGGIVGTAEYLSPEQASGKPATKRSDLYALGVVLYALLTGRLPFTGATPVDILHKHLYGQFDRPARLLPDLPREVDELVCWLLEKNPDERPADAVALGKAVEKLQHKMQRKSEQTEAVVPAGETVAENAWLASKRNKEGPATLMSRLMRQELEREKAGGPLNRFFNRPLVLVVSLLLCLGAIAYAFWPASAATLYERGAVLMESDHYSDWKAAWRDYFEPLERDHPGHPYKEQVENFRRRIAAAEAGADEPFPTEAARLYDNGQQHLRAGNPATAEKVWRGVVQVFDGVPEEETWVRKARRGLLDLEKAEASGRRWQTVREALKRADALGQKGEAAKADQIRQGVIDLYQNDPTARAVVQEARQALGKQ